MSLSINNLPEDVLIDIMRRLDKKSLAEASLTCKRWNQVTEERCSWPIELCGRNISELRVSRLQRTNRKYYIELSLNKYFEIHKIDIIKELGGSVVEVNWVYSGGTSQFLERLKYFPNLECIALHSANFVQASNADDCNLPELKKLKTLRTYDCSDNVFKYFRTSFLKSLVLGTNWDPSMQQAGDFYRRQKNLTELVVIPKLNDVLFQELCHATPNGAVPCKLNQLTLLCEYVSNNVAGLVQFIEMHSKTLRKLDLCGTFSNAIYQIVFDKLKALKFLEIGYLSEKTFGENLNQNESIEILKFTDSNFSPLALSQLCNCLPDVKMLYLIRNSTAERRQIISTAFNKLTTLCMHYVCNEALSEIKFPNLTSFCITSLSYNNIDWDAFSKSNSRITEIIIKQIRPGVLNLDDIDAMTRNLKLQTLKIGFGFRANKRFLSIIDKNCSHLKVLELHKSCGIENLLGTNSCAAPLRLSDEIEIPDFIRHKCPFLFTQH